MSNVEPAITSSTIAHLANIWPSRAAVRGQQFESRLHIPYDPSVPDFPHTLIPFWDHPKFSIIDDEKKQEVLTWAWIAYNQRTIDAEDYVANPAFAKLLENQYPGLNIVEAQMSIRQSLVDEHYHSLMHTIAMNRTHDLRGTDSSFRFSKSVTARVLSEQLSLHHDAWQRDLLVIAFAVVSEISINAYLDLLAKDDTVHELHRTVAILHNKDEAVHSSILVEVCKLMYPLLSKKQKEFFCMSLPIALKAFVAQDYSVLETILRMTDVRNADTIIADVSESPSNLVRDYRGLHRLVRELELEDAIEFDFSTST